MAKKTKNAKSAAPYVRRLAEDEYIQEQLRNAAGRLREAYGRASRERGRAAEDRKFYDNLREAATSIRQAVSRLRRKPEPKPKRWGRKLAVVAVAGGVALLIARRRKASTESSPKGAPMLDSAGSGSGGNSQEPVAKEAVGGAAAN